MPLPLKGSQEAKDKMALARAGKSAFAAELPEGVDIPPPPPPPQAAPQINSEPAPVAPVRNLFNGQMRKLSVIGRNGSMDDPIPGWYLYWFEDVGNNGTRIAQAKMSGYEHVQTDEIALYDNLVPGNNDLGSIVRTVLNPRAVPPTYGYLMKKPLELHQMHQLEMQQVNRNLDAAVRAGTVGASSNDGRYRPGEIRGSALPEIKISSNLNR